MIPIPARRQAPSPTGQIVPPVRRRRAALLALLVPAAATCAIANAVAIAAPADQPTRLGQAIGQALRDSDKRYAERERALALRERAQRAAEQQLQDSQAANPANPADPGKAPADAYDELARIYQAMKPARAAPIFEKLGPEVQLNVARKMRGRAAALVMANMSPVAAAELSMALAGHPVSHPQPQPARKSGETLAAMPDATAGRPAGGRGIAAPRIAIAAPQRPRIDPPVLRNQAAGSRGSVQPDSASQERILPAPALIPAQPRTAALPAPVPVPTRVAPAALPASATTPVKTGR